MADMTQVLARLEERTSQNRVPWRKGNTSDTYEAELGTLKLFVLGPRRGNESTIYLIIRDEKGNSIGDALYLPSDPSLNSNLVSILAGARKIASDDPRLDEVLDALDTVPPVS